MAQSNQTAALTWTASYEAYGKRTKETGTNQDKQRGNSKDEDPTGLLNEGFRYRDLETGVWLSRDPAGFVDGPNVYAYVQQNPWTKFDPDGLDFSIVNSTINGTQHTAITLKVVVLPAMLDKGMQDPKNLAQQASLIKKNIESHWTGGDEKRNMSWSMNVDIRVGKSREDIQPDEHTIIWTADKQTSHADFGGKQIRLGSLLVENAGHETGHSMGLHHPANVTESDMIRFGETYERKNYLKSGTVYSSEKSKRMLNEFIASKTIERDSAAGTYRVAEGESLTGLSGNNPIRDLPEKNVMRYSPLTGADVSKGVDSRQIDLINQYYDSGDLNGAHYDKSDPSKWSSSKSQQEVFGTKRKNEIN